jgi:Domain of unknown function (DUF4262)
MNLPKRHYGRRHDPACPDCAKEAAGGTHDADHRDYMSWITAKIGEHGWAVSGIYGDDQAPPWAYSVGMWLTCQTSELVMCGVPMRNAAGIINVIGSRLADGDQIGPDDVLTDVCPAPLTVRPVDLSWRMSTMFAVSDEFYGFVRPPYMQVVWADKDGRFPWEPGFPAGFQGMQPLLWLPRDDNPPSPWTRLDQAS